MSNAITYFRELIDLPQAVRDLKRQRELTLTLSRRDFLARFRGSLGGVSWSLLLPFFMMVIYTMVFSSFLKVKYSVSDSPYTFAVYLLCGLLPWNAFSETITTSTGVIRGNQNLVKRVVFPLETLPVSLVLVALFQQVIGFTLLIPLAWWVTGKMNWTLLLVPLGLLIQFLLFTGLGWLWSSLSVYLVDLKQVTPLLLTVGMFLTPLFYPATAVPEWARWLVIDLNPMAKVIEFYRLIFMEGLLPPLRPLASLVIFSLAVYMVGRFWFLHTKKGFADIL
jgi:lipopolysaccharide transport system permease protein